VLLLQQGEVDEASGALQTCLGIWREQGNQSREAMELCSLGVARWTLGDLPGARALLRESIDLAHAIDEPDRESTALGNLGVLEVHDNHPELAIELLEQALAIDMRLGRTWACAVMRANLAGARLRAGRAQAAYGSLREHAAGILAFGDLELTIDVLELLASAFAQLSDPPSKRCAIRSGCRVPFPTRTCWPSSPGRPGLRSVPRCGTSSTRPAVR
jgi:tetratricopeptide (TPR) repeat protein